MAITRIGGNQIRGESLTSTEIKDQSILQQDFSPTVDTTLKGNTFNGADQLVELDSLGRLPALDGSLLTGVSLSGAAGGDLLGNYPNPVVAKIQGRLVDTAIPTLGQILKWDGSKWAPADDEGGGFANPMTTAEDLIVGGVGGAAQRLAKGTDGQVLKVVAGSLAWAADDAGSGVSYPLTAPNDGSVAQYSFAGHSGTGMWSFAGGIGLNIKAESGMTIESTTGSLDLGAPGVGPGSIVNLYAGDKIYIGSPLQIDITSKGAGKVLTSDASGNATWEAAAGGPGGGYATVVADAPTGTGATDRVAINAALAALPAEGGVVVLQEGTYVTDQIIVLPSGKPVWIKGQGDSTQLHGTGALETAGGPFIKGPASGNIPMLKISDMALVADQSFNVNNSIELTAAAGQTFSNITFENILWTATATTNATFNQIMTLTANTGVIENITISKCRIIPGPNSPTGNNADVFKFSEVSTGTIKDVLIKDNHILVRTGIEIEGEGYTITGNRIRTLGPTDRAIRMEGPASDVVISGNSIAVENTGFGIDLNQAATGVSITGNEIDSADDGVIISHASSDRITVSGNTIRATNVALDVGASVVNPVIVTGNTFTGTVTDSSGVAVIDGLRGRKVAATAPTDGQVLTWDNTSSTWEPADAAGGPGGGYATVVADAPSGTANDDLLLSAALTALPAEGGKVILQEGNYVFTNKVNIPSGKPIWIQGQGDATTLSQATAMEQAGVDGCIEAPTSGNCPALRISDMNFYAAEDAVMVGIWLKVLSGQTLENIEILNCSTSNLATKGIWNLCYIESQSATTGVVENVRFENNRNHSVYPTGGFEVFHVNNRGTGVWKNISVHNNYSEQYNVARLEGTIANPLQNVSIQNNVWDAAGDGNVNQLLSIANVNGALVSGNSCNGGSTSAWASFGQTDNANIVGNIADNTGAVLFSLNSGSGYKISDNATGDWTVLSSYNGSSIVFDNNAGTITDSTVAKVAVIDGLRGRKVSSATPNASDVLTWNDTNSEWEPAAPAGGPGGGGGYATVVADAPTGTDDNLKVDTAITALGADGGTVVLQEGNYVFNGQVVIPSGKRIWIKGQGESTIVSNTTLFENNAIGSFAGPASGDIPSLRISDIHFYSQLEGYLVGLELSPTAGQTFSNIEMFRCFSTALAGKCIWRMLSISGAIGSAVENVSFCDNRQTDVYLSGGFEVLYIDTSGTATKNILVKNNLFRASYAEIKFTDGLVIEGNTFDSAGINTQGINCQVGNGQSIISNNSFIGGGSGSSINFSGTGPLQAVGNTSDHTGANSGMRFFGSSLDNVVVVGNKMSEYLVDASVVNSLNLLCNVGTVIDNSGNATILGAWPIEAPGDDVLNYGFAGQSGVGLGADGIGNVDLTGTSGVVVNSTGASGITEIKATGAGGLIELNPDNASGRVDLYKVLQVWGEASPPAVSSANAGKIYFDSTADKFKVSENGGAYQDLVGGGGGGWVKVADVAASGFGINIPGLDIGTDKMYRLFMELVPSTSTNVEIRWSGISTASLYYTQTTEASGASITGARSNNNLLLASTLPSGSGAVSCDLTISNGGGVNKTRMYGTCTVGEGAGVVTTTVSMITINNNNLTSLDIIPSAGGVWSSGRVILWKPA